jgi:hypothetical protein
MHFMGDFLRALNFREGGKAEKSRYQRTKNEDV